MELIRKKAFARAGLIGNPSDGYHGKTISIGLGNLWAQVSLYEWEQIEIVWSQEDRSRFDQGRKRHRSRRNFSSTQAMASPAHLVGGGRCPRRCRICILEPIRRL